MRSFTPPAESRFYAGVDLHARVLFLVVLDRDGRGVFAHNLPASAEPFFRAVGPFRDRILVACECRHCWYWTGRGADPGTAARFCGAGPPESA